MSKYNVGDKVVIRKDLKVGWCYGKLDWNRWMEYMKEEDYVVIEKDCEDGDYYTTDDFYISEEMIEGLYTEPEVDPSEGIKSEIINAALDKLNNAYLNESTVTITARDILVIQSLINESNIDYKFNLK